MKSLKHICPFAFVWDVEKNMFISRNGLLNWIFLSNTFRVVITRVIIPSLHRSIPIQRDTYNQLSH